MLGVFKPDGMRGVRDTDNLSIGQAGLIHLRDSRRHKPVSGRGDQQRRSCDPEETIFQSGVVE
jgi:hypothetical protein